VENCENKEKNKRELFSFTREFVYNSNDQQLQCGDVGILIENIIRQLSIPVVNILHFAYSFLLY